MKNIKTFILLIGLFQTSFISLSYAQAQQNTPTQNTPAIDLSTSELAWIADHPVIKSTNDNGWPPFDFARLGNPAGFSIDYLNLVASKVGLKVEYRQGEWDDLMGFLENRTVDISHSITKNEERERFLLFTEPYLNIPSAYFAKKGAEQISDEAGLIGKKIGMIREWGLAEEYKRLYPDLDLVEFETEIEAIFALSDNTIDIFVGSVAVANYTMVTNFIFALEVIGFLKTEEMNGQDALHLAVRSDWPELISILHKGMAAVTHKEFSELSSKWQISVNQNAVLDFTAKENDWILKHPIINATNQMDWPPFDFVENGQAAGFSIDYLNLLAERIGVKVNYVNGHDWDGLTKKLINKEIDLTHSLVGTKARDEYLNFTSAYINLPFLYYGKVGSEPVLTINDLKEKRVGYIPDYAHAEIYKRDYPELDLYAVSDVKEGLVAISTGQIDVFATTPPIANYMISRNFITGIEIIGQNILPELEGNISLKIGVRKDWLLFKGILEKAMTSISQEEYIELSSKWLSKMPLEEDIGLTEEEKNWLRNNPIIKTAVDTKAYPFEYVDSNDEINGISGDLLKRFSEKLNVEFKWAGNVNFAEAINSIKNGTALLMPFIAKTPERVEYLDFTDSYLSISNVIFSRENGEVFGTMTALNGKTISQVKGFSVLENIRRDYPGINIIEVNTVDEAIIKLSTREVDAFVGSIPAAARNITENSLTNIIVSGETPYKMDVGLAVNKDQKVLKGIMVKALASISDAEMASITQKWLSLGLKAQIDYKIVWQVVGISLFVLSIISIWLISLRSEIKRRKVVEANLIILQKETESAKWEAELANKAKSTFLANMSHEIRTPLNAIIGFSDIMSSELFGKIENLKYQDYVKHINGSGVLLSHVINDILDLSKIEAGKWKLSEEKFPILKNIIDVSAMMENQAGDKNISLVTEVGTAMEGVIFFGDENCIKRILLNLFSNAVKFTKDGGEIRCSLSQKKSKELVISIKDTGVGIPNDKLNTVINPFEQIQDGPEIKEKGTGLGLSIVKELTELHGGRFYLKSELNVGTEAIVIFPADRVSQFLS